MKIEDILKEELQELTQNATSIQEAFQDSVKKDKSKFIRVYQSWFTQACRIVKILAPERFNEFSGYYNVESKNTPESKYTQKEVRYKDETTYTILDYILGVEAKRYTGYMGGDIWNPASVVATKLNNQLEIINSISHNIDKALFDLGFELLISLQDRELEAAGDLSKHNPRAAAVLAGVVLENHLTMVVENRSLALQTDNPTLLQIIDILKEEGIIDSVRHRKIQFLIDLHDSCTHPKDKESDMEDVESLVKGVKEIVKTIF